MKKYAHLRAKARVLRKRDGKTLDELAEMLAMPRTTVYYWIKDLPLPPERIVEGRRKAAWAARGATKRKYAKLRQEAYSAGMAMIDELSLSPTFRDFVTMYIGEGYKRRRNTVNICNSDPRVIRLCFGWMKKLANPERPFKFTLWYFEDQSTDDLRAFWATELDIAPDDIQLRAKDGAGKLARRSWRSQYGVMSVTVNDTYLRAKLQSWIDWIKEQW